MLKINDKVRIKDSAWQKFCTDNGYNPNSPNIGEQPIIDIQQNYSARRAAYYLLTLPFIWWYEEDLEPVLEVIYEQVTAIKGNGRLVHKGDILRCSCKYEVHTLHPIWDSKTGKHLTDHKNNSFSCKMITSCVCPIHGKKHK